MIKYRFFFLAIAYIAVILCCIMVTSARGCYTHNKTDAAIANMPPAKFYFYDKHVTGIDRLKQGDLVLFRTTGAGKELRVRRLLAKPGDQVAFRDGVFQVNGTPYQPPLNTGASSTQQKVLEPVTVPSGMLFMIPDDIAGIDLTGRDCLVPQYRIKGKFLKSLFKDESL
ncbi:MAG: signal peptidase I [Planctomycetota bacterium]